VQAGRRCVLVTERRARPDFVRFTRHLLEHVYRSARRVHLVMDNLSTHFRSCFEEVLGVNAAQRLLRRVEFHYTPKHQLAEHGRDRNRCPHATVPGSTHAGPANGQSRGQRLAETPQRLPLYHRVELHAARRGSKDAPSLCSAINVLRY
jgi:hypothetical protein